MGAGKYFTNYKEAEDELLKRNFPDIAEDYQESAIFVPESFLPKVPRAVTLHYLEAFTISTSTIMEQIGEMMH